MSRFREYSDLDDTHVSDGDRGFFRLVTRQRGEKLQAGEVTKSENGRMETDGNWQVRKGIAVKTPSIQFTGDPLTLDFVLNDVTPPTLDDLAVSAVYGSAGYSDPTTDDEYVIILIDAFAALVRLVAGNPTTRLPYPVGVTLTSGVDALQVFDKFRIFRGKNAVSIEWDGVLKQLLAAVSIVRVSNVVTVTTASPHGLSAGDTIYVQGITEEFEDTGSPNGTFSILASATPTTFTYDNSGTNTGGFGLDSDFSITRGFYLVPAGTYTQPRILDTENNTVIDTNGKATVSETAHALTTGDTVVIRDTANSDLQYGLAVNVEVDTADQFHYQAESKRGTFSIVYTKRQSVGGGYIHQPNASWGIMAQGRLVVPFEIRNNDELIFSDIFDADTFDPIFNQFRPAGGTADFLVAVYPWVDDRLLVLNRRSIHAIYGTSGSLIDTQLREITREVGCVARKSVAAVGDNVMWLSDNGVMMINTTTEYNQLAVAMPMSEPIQDIFTRVNWTVADKATAAYFNNRYYLALPIDGSSTNNAVLVYNFLNQGWESLDTFSSEFGNLAIVTLFTAREGNLLKLFFTTDSGAVHEYEQLEGVDELSINYASLNVTRAIAGFVRTRSLFMGDNEIKRFNRLELKVQGAADITGVDVALDSPESGLTVDSGYTIVEGARSSRRIRVARRGYSMNVGVGMQRGKLESVVSEAVVTNRSTRTR